MNLLLLSKDNEELRAKVADLVCRFRAYNDAQESPEIIVTSKMVWQS